MTSQIGVFDVEHLHGPEEISYAEDELIVVCLVRDGLPWVKTFVEHYFSLGVKHIVFLDNGSTDGTVEALKLCENVTVLRTEAPFKDHEDPMKRYLIERFGQRRWSLCVDIDEFFDYPYSDVISLRALLGYLGRKSYTAVVAQMLDMFPEKLLSGQESNLDEPLKEVHRFYDISNLEVQSIEGHRRCPPDTTYANDQIDFFKAGIRWTIFGINTALTKHPLMFLDGKVRPIDPGPHWVGNARVADFTCVLFHYKFLGEPLHKVAVRTVRGQQHRKHLAPYQKYLEVLEQNPNLELKRETSREISSVNDLLENGFLVASEDYVSWVNAEEERSLSQAPPVREPRALVETLVESRRQRRVKTLRVGRLERRLLELEQEIGDPGRKIQELEQQLRDRSQKLQRSKRRQQRLRKELNSLRQQAEWRPDILKGSGMNPRTVVDVGVGRGTPQLYEAFPTSFQVLIEPLKEHEPDLQNILKQYEGRYFLTAVGSSNRRSTITVEPRPHMSSFLERTAKTSTGDPTDKREVPVTTLDTLMEEHNLQPPFGLKIDTEGFELEAIKGAPKFLRKTQFVIAEVSITKRFVGGYSFSEFTEAMNRNGFFLWDLMTIRRRFVDAVFRPSFNHWPTSLLLSRARLRARNVMRAIRQRRT
jgi:FkbM family methyltransferase